MSEILYIWADSPALSVAIWLVIAITLLYFGRPHGHQLLRSTGRAVSSSLRLAAKSIRQLEDRVAARNRDVLLAAGREETERAIEREFARVHGIVERDLGEYPQLHRRLSDVLEKIESDYQECKQEAPLPPEWSEVTSTISSLPTQGDPNAVRILENIKAAVEKSHKETLKAHQKNVQERHKILHGMQADWRSVATSMDKVQKAVTSLDEQAQAIDRHMDRYESMRRGDDKAVNALTASSLTQFLIAGVVLVIAAFGGLVNFQLIALPMSEMVGGGAYVGAMRAADVAALVIIMVEISMGIFFLEAMGITRLFPMIGRLDDRTRRRMAVVAFTLLLLFACIESSLAYLRDLLAQDRAALTESLAGTQAAAQATDAELRWIPTAAQALLGFVLPFALAFVAIPLEAFVGALRTVLGLLTLGLLRAVRVVVRMTGGLANHASKMLISVYDLVIMVPLAIERFVVQMREAGPAGDEPASAEAGGKQGKRESRKAAKPAQAEADDTPLTPKEA